MTKDQEIAALKAALGLTFQIVIATGIYPQERNATIYARLQNLGVY